LLGATDGEYPRSGLLEGADGALYGTTSGGGAFGEGTVFRMAHGLSGWRRAVIHSFERAKGAVPRADLTQSADGALVGTTSEGGAADLGTVFRLARRGGSWSFSLLHQFDGTDGATPSAAVAQ